MHFIVTGPDGTTADMFSSWVIVSNPPATTTVVQTPTPETPGTNHTNDSCCADASTINTSASTNRHNIVPAGYLQSQIRGRIKIIRLRLRHIPRIRHITLLPSTPC